MKLTNMKEYLITVSLFSGGLLMCVPIVHAQSIGELPSYSDPSQPVSVEVGTDDIEDNFVSIEETTGVCSEPAVSQDLAENGVGEALPTELPPQ